jgi:hypothetical protein
MMSLRKLVQILLLTGILPGACFGQLKFEGPRQVEPGELARIAIDGVKGLNDPKIECVPKNTAWEAVQRLDGSPVIIFYTKQEGIYTFIVVGNKDNKTYLETFTLVVGRLVPPPPPLPPVPVTIGKYTKRLSSPYQVSPDNESLSKLIGVYQAIANRAAQMQNYKQVESVLADSTEKAIGKTALRAVRDEVSVILQADLAVRGSTTYDSVATMTIFTELVKSLTPLLEK